MGAGGAPLFTSIASITDSHNVVMALAATGSATVTTGIGFDYQEIVLKDLQVSNFIAGINIVAATQYHIRHAYVLGTSPLLAQNILWSDQGDGSITESTFIASVAGAFNTVDIRSGGGLRFQNNKVLAEAATSNCIAVTWEGASSVGPWIIGNSIEGGCTVGINVNGTGAAAHGGMVIGNEVGIASAGTSIGGNPTTAHPNWIFADNLIRQAGGGSGILLANFTNFNAYNNNGQNTDASGGGLMYNISSTASGSVYVSSTNINTPIQNASANVVIDDPIGLAFASLPASAANGSRIYVTNGSPNSTPCTGASTGALALRLNGAWSCGSAGISALTGDVTASGSGSVAATLATAQPAVHTWALAQTFTVAPVFTDQSGSRTALGLGTAATQNTGISGATLPFLNGVNTWASAQTFSAAMTYGGVTLSNSVTGTGSMVLASSPTLVTPVLGVATATSINKNIFTAPATSTTWKGLDGGTNALDLTANVYAGVTSGNFALSASVLGMFVKNNSVNGAGLHAESSNATLEFIAGNAAIYIASPNNIPLNFYLNGAQVASLGASGSFLSFGATGGIGYGTGAGGTVTQATNRTTGVTLNTVTGAITLVSAAGSATPATFTVTNSSVAAADTVHVSQKSGTDKYEIFVTNVAAGSFAITFFTTGGTTTEQPVFNFTVMKGSTSFLLRRDLDPAANDNAPMFLGVAA